MVIHVMFSDLTCYFPPSPFKILLLCPLKLKSIANKMSCTLSLICECSLHLAQTKTWISRNDTFFPVVLWNVAALSPTSLQPLIGPWSRECVLVTHGHFQTIFPLSPSSKTTITTTKNQPNKTHQLQISSHHHLPLLVVIIYWPGVPSLIP